MRGWVSPAVRDGVVHFVEHYSAFASLPKTDLLTQIGLGRDKYYAWRNREGEPNQHNARIPRGFWLLEWERQAILTFHGLHPDEGYRRLSFMMMDTDVVAVSPSSVYRVLKSEGCLRSNPVEASKKGTGFKQPSKPHKHWHVDISYLNICGTFYYFCGLLDGHSRYIVHWEIRDSMTEADIEIIIQRAKEKYPKAKPRIISDNGPQFLAREFKEFIRISGMTHVRTSPYYPQSNGKIERFHQSLKRECIRPKTPLSLEDARRIVGDYVNHYNQVRLHSAIGYVTPKDKLEGRAEVIQRERHRKLQRARDHRKRSGTSALTEAAA